MNSEPNSSLVGQTQGTPFLKLPAELRNRIYDFCAEDGALNLPASRSSFGKLRYVCQLLYNEFSPVYLARTAVVLQSADLERYVAVFYPSIHSHKAGTPDSPTGMTRLPNPLGQIRVDTSLGATLDLSYLANLGSKKLQFTLVRGNCTSRPLRQASDLLRAIVESSDSTPFQQIIEKILFRYSFIPEVVFKLRHGIPTSLPEQCTLRTHNFQNPSWLSQQGLPLLCSFDVVFESSEEVLRVTRITRSGYPGGFMQLRPLHELDESDARENFSVAQLSDLNLSQSSSKSGHSHNLLRER